MFRNKKKIKFFSFKIDYILILSMNINTKKKNNNCLKLFINNTLITN